MADRNDAGDAVPSSALDPDEKRRRAGSFGRVASQYDRYRPGPPAAAVDWFVPTRVSRAVDLGAGTGALTRQLVDRADEVVAVEPDPRMRLVLAEQVPSVRAVEGRGEAIPLPDRCADVVIASSSWHWMDPAATCAEVARVLVPGGTLGAVWSGPDRDGAFLVEAQALLADHIGIGSGDAVDLRQAIFGDARRPDSTLQVPPGAPFGPVEHEVFRWEMALTADDLVGLLGTMSSVILLDDATRDAVLSATRRLLRELLGVEGDATVDVAFRADAFRTRYQP